MSKKLQEEEISRRAFDSLDEYSCSLPTGTTVGKVWKLNRNAFNGGPEDWLICEYVDIGSETEIGIEYRRPVIKEAS